MPFTETQLKKLVEDVEREFTSHLAKAEEEAKAEPLLKAEDEGKKPEEKKPEEKKPEGKEAPAEEKPAAEAKPEAPAQAPAEAPAQAPQNPAQPAGHDYDEQDIEHLKKMYMSMSKEELKLHHDVIAECMRGMDKGAEMAPGAPVQKSELNAHGEKENPPQPKVKGANLDSDPKNGGIEGAQPHDAPGAKSPASEAHGAKINKAEPAVRNGGKIEATGEPKGSPGAKSPASKDQGNLNNMEKSEQNGEELLKAELTAVNAKYDDLKKNFDAVQEFLTKLVKKTAAPAPRAIESLETIAKSEGSVEEQSLTKSEINAKLLAKSQDPKTSKADRDAINRFYLDGESIKGISHLLK